MLRSKRTILPFLFASVCVSFTQLAGAQIVPAPKPDADSAAQTGSIAVPRSQSVKGLINTVPVQGTITESSTGKPLRGINVRYKDLTAAITDSAGNFTLKVPDYEVAIMVEGSGYQAKEIALKGRKTVTAALYEDNYNSFYDVATLPFGQVQKNKIPYAVNSVQTNGAWDHSTETPDAYLQGRVPGLQATRRSGTPNIGADFFLRGYTSLYATNQPLVVVDGVIFDITDYGNSLINNHYTNPLSFIDVRDIDNVTVLKDASSIYGTKGANGAILITTARAKELATRIDFAVYGGVNFAPGNLPVLDATDYKTYLARLLQTTGLTNDQIQAYPYMNDNTSNPDYYRYHNNTDWQKQVLHNSFSKNVYLKITGGDNIARYALSLGYMTNEGVIKSTDLTKYNTRFNADLNLSKRLTATTNLSFSFNEQNLRDQGIAPKTSPLYLALTKSPLLTTNEVSNTGVQSPDLAASDTFNTSNPLAILNNAIGLAKNYRFFGSIGFNYALTRGISLHTLVSATIDEVRENTFIPAKGVVNDTLNTAIADNRSGTETRRLFTLFNDSYIGYSKTFHRIHTLSARAGFRFIKSQSEQDIGQGYNSATDELKSVSFGLTTLRKIGGNLGEWRWINNYLNADYGLLDKYFLSFNMAVDGSSRFGKESYGGASILIGRDKSSGSLLFNDQKFAVLPSIAGAWLLSSENFMAHSSFIDLIKLRASYSIAGNDDIGNYTARQYYISQNVLGIQGLVRANFGNSDLLWERVNKTNAGVDLAFLNERLNISLDVFQNRTDNMIINEPTQAAAGLLYAVTNSGAMKTNGVEASITGRIINKADLKWDVGVNLAQYRSEIKQLPVSMLQTSFGGATIVSSVGQVPNLFYGFKTAGVYTTDAEATAAGLSVKNTNGTLVPFKGGDMRFVDVNGDHLIDDNDRQVIGDPNPDFYGSVNTSLHWKQFSLDALFTFSKGNDIYNYIRNQLEAGSGYANQTEAIKNSWKQNGDVTDIPKITWGDPMGNSRFSDRWIEDGSYFRLRTLSLSYNLPFKNNFFKYSIVYLTGNNVFTLTKYLGYDPEFSASESLFGQGIDLGLEPQYRSVQVGLRIGL